ncbi:MAG: hypothetical protein ACLRWF_01950 [Ruthenibacterium sp.]
MQEIAQPLLRWFDENKRSLPFRAHKTPYRVWVSEVMLQQTRVAAVLPYYERFMRELPTVQALAACPPEKLAKLWEGLGYYSRARNLQRAAQAVVEQYGGELPASYEALRALPGIGDYTAGAVASLAFGLPYAAVDGNCCVCGAGCTPMTQIFQPPPQSAAWLPSAGGPAGAAPGRLQRA